MSSRLGETLNWHTQHPLRLHNGSSGSEKCSRGGLRPSVACRQEWRMRPAQTPRMRPVSRPKAPMTEEQMADYSADLHDHNVYRCSKTPCLPVSDQGATSGLQTWAPVL